MTKSNVFSDMPKHAPVENEDFDRRCLHCQQGIAHSWGQHRAAIPPSCTRRVREEEKRLQISLPDILGNMDDREFRRFCIRTISERAQVKLVPARNRKRVGTLASTIRKESK